MSINEDKRNSGPIVVVTVDTASYISFQFVNSIAFGEDTKSNGLCTIAAFFGWVDRKLNSFL